MSSAFDTAWATEEERPTVDHSMSQDELITEFHRLDTLVKEHGSRRREIGMALAGIAHQKKGQQNTVHLQSSEGKKVDVQFGSETQYVTEEMMEVSSMLGLEQFDQLFETKIEFKAKRRELKKFLNTVFPDEKIETAKQMIQDATVTKDKTPYVSVV
jgi:hypothetical protein